MRREEAKEGPGHLGRCGTHETFPGKGQNNRLLLAVRDGGGRG